ncbi:MAG: AraC family transcriptional regulator [Cyclobacteriaceae bacterium]|nr:AraC family transcriptional regulator [Cyclobacteriaceae bacterium]
MDKLQPNEVNKPKKTIWNVLNFKYVCCQAFIIKMINLFDYINKSESYKKFIIDDLLFVEYKCVVEETKAGIWSDTNYFVFVTSGKKMWKSIYNEYIVEAGDSLFVKRGANLVHQYFDEDYCALMIFISDDFIRNFMGRFSSIIRSESNEQLMVDSVIRIRLDAYLEGYVNSLASYFGAQVLPDKNLLKLKFEELLLNIFTRPLHKEVARYLATLNRSQAMQLQQVMEENFAYNLKLEELASLCNMSLSSFKRVFNSTYHSSPGKWLLEKRLSLSSYLLRSTDKNVNEVAFESGFEDISNFIRSFKKKFNRTPLQYRAESA